MYYLCYVDLDIRPPNTIILKQKGEDDMGALKINCYCDCNQMDNALSMVSSHLENCDLRELSDIDIELDEIRICVDFNVYMDSVKLKGAEILDRDWDLLYEDTAVFTSRLKHILETYNNDRQSALEQAYEIINDRFI